MSCVSLSSSGWLAIVRIQQGYHGQGAVRLAAMRWPATMPVVMKPDAAMSIRAQAGRLTGRGKCLESSQAGCHTSSCGLPRDESLTASVASDFENSTKPDSEHDRDGLNQPERERNHDANWQRHCIRVPVGDCQWF